MPSRLLDYFLRRFVLNLSAFCVVSFFFGRFAFMNRFVFRTFRFNIQVRGRSVFAASSSLVPSRHLYVVLYLFFGPCRFFRPLRFFAPFRIVDVPLLCFCGVSCVGRFASLFGLLNVLLSCAVPSFWPFTFLPPFRLGHCG